MGAEASCLQAQESARRRWDALSPEEKLELLEASYEEEKEKARVAKESGRLGRRDKADMEARLKDIREQISELKVVVGKRKKEMKRLKVGEEAVPAALGVAGGVLKVGAGAVCAGVAAGRCPACPGRSGPDTAGGGGGSRAGGRGGRPRWHVR